MTGRFCRVSAAVLCLGIAMRSQMQSLGSNDSFTDAKLTAKETRQVLDGVEQSAYDTPGSWQKELRLRRIDLGGSPGIVVQGSNMLCGGTGNCQTWVFRKSNGGWISMIGGDQAPIVSSFEFSTTMTHGFRDFNVVTNLSATSSKRTTFKFDGKVYRPR